MKLVDLGVIELARYRQAMKHARQRDRREALHRVFGYACLVLLAACVVASTLAHVWLVKR